MKSPSLSATGSINDDGTKSAIPATKSYFGRDLEAMSFAGNYYRWMLRYFRPFMGSRILEVGAGTGNFSSFLLEARPDELICLEPSDNMFPLLERRLGAADNARAMKCRLSDTVNDLKERMDTVIYVNVLEHVPDDFAEVRLALSTLKPGGHLLIFVPALPWLFGTADQAFGHCRRYTRDALLKLLHGLPVAVEDCRYFDVLGILPWWVSFVLLRIQTMGPGMMRAYDRFIVPLSSRLEGWVEPPLGKNLLLSVRKLRQD